MAKSKGVEVGDPMMVAQLRTMVASLVAGGASQWVVAIKRRQPNIQRLWSWWKHKVNLELVDDIAEYCYGEGGKEYEYRISIKNLEGDPPKVDGKPLTDFVIPALQTAPDKSTDDVTTDPLLNERKQRLADQRMQMEIERQEVEIAKQQRRLDKLRSGKDDDDDDDEEGEYNPWAMMGMGMDPRMAARMGMGGMGMMNPMMNPNHPMSPYYRPPENRNSDLVTLLPIVMKGLESIADKLGGNSNGSGVFEQLVMLKKSGLMPDNLSPKDMMGMFSPFVTEMGRMSADANKTLMENLAAGDIAFKTKVLDLMAATGAEPDEIDKWQKILGVATTTIGNGVRAIFSARSGKGGPPKVPVLNKPRTPGLPAAPVPAADAAPSDARPSDAAVAVNPAEAAKNVQRERVRVFLLTQEQEMLVGSEPQWAAEKLDEAWLSLPAALRAQIMTAQVDKIYELLREYEPELVDRILAAVTAQKDGGLIRWCNAFWSMITAPEEDEPEPGGEDEPKGPHPISEEPDEKPEPEPEPEAEEEPEPEPEVEEEAEPDPEPQPEDPEPEPEGEEELSGA